MRILITNFHSIQNKGDLGIVLGLMESLQKETLCTFSIIGRDVGEREWWRARGVDFFLPLLDLPRQDATAVVNKYRALVHFLRYYVSLFCLARPSLAAWYYRSPEVTATLATYRAVDVVISKGGSFFREPEYRLNLLPVGIVTHAHQLKAAQVLRKRVVLSAQSFGPIHNPYSRLLLRRVLRRAALITTRERESAAFLERLGVRRNVRVAGDSAFLLAVGDEATPLAPVFAGSEGKRVGITVREWSDRAVFERYLSSVANLIEVYAPQQYAFYLMPQVIGPSVGEDDRRVSHILFERLSPEARARTVVVEEDLEVKGLIARYRQMDYFLATRLHSAIFALVGDVPVMAIGYEPKTEGIFRDLGLESYTTDIRTLSRASLLESFGALLTAPRSRFAGAHRSALALARENIRSILAVLPDPAITNHS